MGRGMLSKRVQCCAIAHIGREISQCELRLIPYIQHTMANTRRLDINRISEAERKVLSQWREEGYIKGDACDMKVNKDFWTFMCDSLWHGYVAYDTEGN